MARTAPLPITVAELERRIRAAVPDATRWQLQKTVAVYVRAPAKDREDLLRSLSFAAARETWRRASAAGDARRARRKAARAARRRNRA